MKNELEHRKPPYKTWLKQKHQTTEQIIKQLLKTQTKILCETENLGDWIYSVAWSPDGKRIAAGGGFKKIIVFGSYCDCIDWSGGGGVCGRVCGVVNGWLKGVGGGVVGFGGVSGDVLGFLVDGDLWGVVGACLFGYEYWDLLEEEEKLVAGEVSRLLSFYYDVGVVSRFFRRFGVSDREVFEWFIGGLRRFLGEVLVFGGKLGVLWNLS